MAGKIQKQDVKTEAELTGAGATAADLINDTQIYVSQGGTNKTLDDAITDGDVVRPDVVTNAKLANAAAWTLKGRNNAASGDPEDIALADFTEELTPASGDFVVGHLASGELRKFDIGNLPSGGGGQSLNTQEFTSSGNWVVPAGVNQVEILGCGGGGGGGGGGGSSATGGSGGGGGGGASPQKIAITVTPGDTLVVTIGAAGAAGAAGGNNTAGGNGGAGGNTTITGVGVDLTFPGASGGLGGAASGGSFGAGGITYVQTTGGYLDPGFGGDGSSDPATAGSNGARTAYVSVAATGGAAVAAVAANGRPGGGGGSGFKKGGNGGAGITVNGANPGIAPAADAYGAGGGGGGGGRGNTNFGSLGAVGIKGYARIHWFE